MIHFNYYSCIGALIVLLCIAECPYIDLLIRVLHFFIFPRLYLKRNSGIYNNFTMTNTNTIFLYPVLLQTVLIGLKL